MLVVFTVDFFLFFFSFVLSNTLLDLYKLIMD